MLCYDVCCSLPPLHLQAELLQYERRFVELYELVSEKLVETRKYYALHNTLEDSHKFMSDEVNLLDKITEGFAPSMKSQKGREQHTGQDHIRKQLHLCVVQVSAAVRVI